jgi:hypothetical protein
MRENYVNHMVLNQELEQTSIKTNNYFLYKNLDFLFFLTFLNLDVNYAMPILEGQIWVKNYNNGMMVTPLQPVHPILIGCSL